MPVKRYEDIEAAHGGEQNQEQVLEKCPCKTFFDPAKGYLRRGSWIEQRLKWECIGCRVRVCVMISSLVVLFLTLLVRYFFVWQRVHEYTVDTLWFMIR